MKKLLLETVKLVITLCFVVLSVGMVHAWTEPTATPPTGNVAGPVNVSAAEQKKLGILGSNGFFSFGSAWISTSTRPAWPPTGANQLLLAVNGKVGATEYCNVTGEICHTTSEMLGDQILAHEKFSTLNYEGVVDPGTGMWEKTFSIPPYEGDRDNVIIKVNVNAQPYFDDPHKGGLTRVQLYVDGTLCATDQDDRDSTGDVIKEFYVSASCSMQIAPTAAPYTSGVHSISVAMYQEPGIVVPTWWGNIPVTVDYTIFSFE